MDKKPHLMRMTLCNQLITVADTFAQARSTGRKRVSTIVLNQGSKLDSIISGRADVTTKTWEKAMQYFSNNWPQNATWPQNIARPTPTNQHMQEAAQ